MQIKSKILEELNKNSSITTSMLVKLTGLSRQGLNKHLNTLIRSKKILKVGKTRGAYYILNTPKKLREEFGKPILHKGWFENLNVEEDKVLMDIKRNSLLYSNLKENIVHIIDYAFTEMLNNAIEHSKSKRVYYQVQRSEGMISFYVKDHGIGVYENIKNKFHLDSEWHAFEELVKGKSTTDPKNHTGEGLFFTSRIADKFRLTSHKIELFVDNTINDVFAKEVRNYHGTKVEFTIKIDSAKELVELFSEYSTEEFLFDKNKVQVSLFKDGETYISRSQAKRLLSNLDKYNHVILDFKGIKALGQGFTDQIFRVFKSDHPHIKIESINCNQAVDFMIKRAKSSK